MAVYIVTWNFNKEKPNYAKARADFLKVLDGYATIRDRDLESVRFFSTSQTAQQLANSLHTPLDNNDALFVSWLRPSEYSGWLHSDIWKWIEPKL
ncbi:hypothetical protein LNAOJCKE_4630 [Methylorubrum aminovorans]|uniref:Uncharacterized protein n=1 Tax=Methylorubrum aminovorans TaxID=269069 RepID=A0ABQ4UJS2_9HYPH|nr:hypothetical protein LNAOJCKE_4630 [Methylorubrum aminovorans]